MHQRAVGIGVTTALVVRKEFVAVVGVVVTIQCTGTSLQVEQPVEASAGFFTPLLHEVGGDRAKKIMSAFYMRTTMPGNLLT